MSESLCGKLRSLNWVELSHPLDNSSPYWEGMPKGVVELNSVAVPYDEMNLVITTHKFPGQFGTHIDFPAHFVEGGRVCGDFGIKDLSALPLVVLDVSDKCKANADYELTLGDIEEYEAKYGRIPEGSFVAMRTDWYKRWPDGAALSNADAEGAEHFPGWTMQTLKFLYEERKIAGNGHETLDTDAPITSGKLGDLVCERYVLAIDKFQVEVLANLDKVPASGAMIFIAPARITEANGLPVRAWAVFE